MKLTARILVASTALLLATACGDGRSPVGPSPVTVPGVEETAGLLGGSNIDYGLLTCAPLPYDSVTQTVGPLGGVINVGQHSLSIPAGALLQNVTITAVQRPDTLNVVHFEPEGLEFAKKPRLTMSYANCGLLSILIPKRIVYIDGSLSILEILPSADNILARTVSAKLSHFSDYAVAW